METARLFIGLAVAILLPLSTSLRNRHGLSLILTFCYSAYIVLPTAYGWRAAAVLGAGAIAIIGSTAARAQRDVEFKVRIAHRWQQPAGWLNRLQRSTQNASILPQNKTSTFVTITSLALLATILAITHTQDVESFWGFLIRDRVAIIISGLLFATFIGNSVVVLAVRNPLQRLKEQDKDFGSLMPTGEHLGWLERALVFTLVAAGQAEAAALAVTVKSIARLPEAQHRTTGFVEYYLIGTLTSVLIAMICGVLVLRLPPM